MRKGLGKLLGGALFSLAMSFIPFAGASALTVSPPFFDYRLNPGDTNLDVIKLYNESSQEIKVWPILQNFTADDKEAGNPVFYDADKDPKGTALAPWIKVDPTPIVIPPLQRANLTFAINVPKDRVQPGGHFGAIMLSLQPPDAKEGVAVAGQIAALILVNISGDVREVGSIAEYGFKKPAAWYNYRPVDFFVRFENSGNAHLRPVGNVFIKDFMGRQVASLIVNPDFRSVLPQSIRRFDFGWAGYGSAEPSKSVWEEIKHEWNNFALGKYTATLVMNYGSKNQVVTDERVFYVWPWRLMALAGLLLLVLIILFRSVGRAWKRSVIKQYEKTKQ